jgi:hypothetical protein
VQEVANSPEAVEPPKDPDITIPVQEAVAEKLEEEVDPPGINFWGDVPIPSIEVVIGECKVCSEEIYEDTDEADLFPVVGKCEVCMTEADWKYFHAQEELNEIVLDASNIPDTIEVKYEPPEAIGDTNHGYDYWDHVAGPSEPYSSTEDRPKGLTEPPSISWTEKEWQMFKGIGPKLAQKLVENQPYRGERMNMLQNLVSRMVFKRIVSYVGADNPDNY